MIMAQSHVISSAPPHWSTLISNAIHATNYMGLDVLAVVIPRAQLVTGISSLPMVICPVSVWMMIASYSTQQLVICVLMSTILTV